MAEEKDFRPTFDPDKTYNYTWPGQPSRTVTGAELTALCRGADHSILSIEEVTLAVYVPPKSRRPALREAEDKPSDEKPNTD